MPKWKSSALSFVFFVPFAVYMILRYPTHIILNPPISSK
jgi:hypothetical protein